MFYLVNTIIIRILYIQRVKEMTLCSLNYNTQQNLDSPVGNKTEQKQHVKKDRKRNNQYFN